MSSKDGRSRRVDTEESRSKHRMEVKVRSSEGRGQDPRHHHSTSNHHARQEEPRHKRAPPNNTGATYSGSGFKSGHMEVDSLYSGESGSLTVNSMNAPNNSTLQCGCENIDCPFCNQMLSIQMSGQ